MNLKSVVPATALAAVFCTGIASPAAAAQAVLQGREAVLHTSYLGGFAIAGDSGEAGSLTPITAALPTDLSLTDNWALSGSYLFWTFDVFAQWNLTQDYTVDATARTFGGRGTTALRVGGEVVGPDCNSCVPTLELAGLNQQALEFIVDTDTRYSFSSSTTPSQWVDLMRWDPAQARWDRLWDGFGQTQGVSFTRSGHLPAGLYRVQNNAGSVTVDSALRSSDSAWAWTLTLPDAAVSAVPEPGSWALMAAGLLMLGRVAARWRQA